MKDAKGHGSDPRGSAAHQAGVDAVTRPPQFGKNAAENMREAARFVEQSGHPVEVYRNPKSSYIAAWANDKINLNASKSFWKDPVGNMQRAFASGQLSSASPEHTLHHEMGHAIYSPPDNFFTLGHQDMARKEVSKYAAMNPKEFVSEVHAGMKGGRTFSPEVMQVFGQYARKRGKA